MQRRRWRAVRGRYREGIDSVHVWETMWLLGSLLTLILCCGLAGFWDDTPKRSFLDTVSHDILACFTISNDNDKAKRS
jgi:hypothetical protein